MIERFEDSVTVAWAALNAAPASVTFTLTLNGVPAVRVELDGSATIWTAGVGVGVGVGA